MSRFNTRGQQTKPAVATAASPLGTTSRKAPDTWTHEGAKAWKLNPKTDLFLRASASFADGGNTFYESGGKRDETLRRLAQLVAVEDFDWFADFVKWLRRTANIRTAALMIAADGVKARLDVGLQAPENSVMPTNREVIDSVLYRADEPGELLAYWLSQYGRRIPKPVKRGVADAAARLYTTRSLLKYDTGSHEVRFADVLELCHATPKELVGQQRGQKQKTEHGVQRVFIGPDVWQRQLFKFAIDRRHGNHNEIPDKLEMLWLNRELRESNDLNAWTSASTLNVAGMTWEDAFSAVGGKVDKAKLWEAMIPSMGYMALLRNLRSFDEAGVENSVAVKVADRIADPQEVAESRQLPFRFYSAYLNAPSLRWGQALETALDLCLPNVPELSGRTLILIDTSGSMQSAMSGKSAMQCVQAAALFGAALALKTPDRVDLAHFATYTAPIPVPKGGSVLRLTQDVQNRIGQVGHGTEMAGAIRNTYAGHDRVVLFSDMQAFGSWGGDPASSVPANVPVYAFNLRGYSGSPFPTGSAARFTLGGLSDQTFKLIPLLEAGSSGAWPWQV